MFSGIIEETGTIKSITKTESGIRLEVECSFAQELIPEESVAHNGVCLTVESVSGNSFSVTAVDETLKKTNLFALEQGHKINLERSLTLQTRLHGHIVQGHVDSVAKCIRAEGGEDNKLFTFQYPGHFKNLVVEKGSIAVNGVSLTAFNCTENTFTVTIIPFTLEHTTFHELKAGESVNIEFDILGKYVSRWMEGYKK